MSDQPGLARRLGTVDAVVIGLGSMIGAGVFAAFGPAAAAAGSGLLIGLVHRRGHRLLQRDGIGAAGGAVPDLGGTYVYGRERLGDWWGFLAGWGFVVGKTACCAAMALTFASYAVPARRGNAPVAVAAVLGLAAAQLPRRDQHRPALPGSSSPSCCRPGRGGGRRGCSAGRPIPTTWRLAPTPGWTLYGVLQAAGLLFFAFAGYARIATMGEEVRDPRRTIPRAIPIALAITVAVYAVVAWRRC